MATVKNDKTAGSAMVHIALDLLIPTPENPRVFPKDDHKNPSLLQLAESIKLDGILEPLLARPHPDKRGKYDLRAGERRWRASKLAGLKSVPVIVRPMTDQQAMRITFSENDNQAPLHPLEQSRAVKTMLDKGFTFEQIETETGHTKRYLVRLHQLNNLSASWRELIAEHESVRQAFSASHLEKISRHPQPVQEDLLKAMGRNQVIEQPLHQAADLQNQLRDYLHILDAAPFKKDDPNLCPNAGTCIACTKRSDAMPELFDDDDFRERDYGRIRGKAKIKLGARCIDPTCYQNKLDAFLEQKAAELKKEHKSVVIQGHSYEIPKNSPWKNKAFEPWKLTTCKKGDKDARPCLVVTGSETGHVKWVKNPKRPPTKPNNDGAAAKKPKEPTVAQKREELQLTRLSALKDALRKHAKSIVDEHAWPMRFSKRHMLAFVDAYLRYTVHGDKDVLDLFAERSQPAHSDDVLLCQAFSHALDDFMPQLNWLKLEESVRQFAELVHFDFDREWEKVCAKHKEPASWAKEEAAAAADKAASKGAKAKSGKGKSVAGVCSQCGCSQNDPCFDEFNAECCAWANTEQTLCSFCDGDGEGRTIIRPVRDRAAQGLTLIKRSKPAKSNRKK